MPYTSRETLLSRGEAAFHGPLQEAVGGQYLIMCKVRVADVLTCTDADWRRGHGGAISQKHLDFVLCEPASTRIVLAIELDDRSHEAEHRRRRDLFLNEALEVAGVRLLRVKARSNYSAAIIRTLLDAAIGRSFPAESSIPATSHEHAPTP
ncbi:MAG TPA: DUF2726 domain-containing protein [Phycisphaerae bacterium]|nr:DUF2726 domain-containing protein [Phycisphaerae bacterium]